MSEIREYEVFEVENFRFSPRNLLPLEISTESKFSKIKKCLSSQFHFALQISFIIESTNTREFRFGQSWRISRFLVRNTNGFQAKKIYAKS